MMRRLKNKTIRVVVSVVDVSQPTMTQPVSSFDIMVRIDIVEHSLLMRMNMPEKPTIGINIDVGMRVVVDNQPPLQFLACLTRLFGFLNLVGLCDHLFRVGSANQSCHDAELRWVPPRHRQLGRFGGNRFGVDLGCLPTGVLRNAQQCGGVSQFDGIGTEPGLVDPFADCFERGEPESKLPIEVNESRTLDTLWLGLEQLFVALLLSG